MKMNLKCMQLACLSYLILSASPALAQGTTPVAGSGTISHDGTYVDLSGQYAHFGTAGQAYVVVDYNGPKGGTASMNGSIKSNGKTVNSKSSIIASGPGGVSLSSSGSTSFDMASGSGTHTGSGTATDANGNTRGWDNSTIFAKGSGFSSTVSTQNNGSYTVSGGGGNPITVTSL